MQQLPWCCVECLLNKLEDVQRHSVWGKALASLGADGVPSWCSANFQGRLHLRTHLTKLAVWYMTHEALLQQIPHAFCRPRPTSQAASEVSSLSSSCYGLLVLGVCIYSMLEMPLLDTLATHPCCLQQAALEA